MENQLETLEEKVLRLEKEIRERDEKIEEDKNAIRQIQFEANQNKQATLDAKETYVWRTGLKMEKLMQKTGIAFLRSLLVLSDFKKIGLWLALRKGFNELLNKDNYYLIDLDTSKEYLNTIENFNIELNIILNDIQLTKEIFYLFLSNSNSINLVKKRLKDLKFKENIIHDVENYLNNIRFKVRFWDKFGRLCER